jgi:hypothetical protein
MSCRLMQLIKQSQQRRNFKYSRLCNPTCSIGRIADANMRKKRNSLSTRIVQQINSMFKTNQLFREFVGHLSGNDHAHAVGH